MTIVGGPLCKAPPPKNMKMVEHCETERVEYYETEMVEHYDSDMDSAMCALQSFHLYPNEQSKRRGEMIIIQHGHVVSNASRDHVSKKYCPPSAAD